MENNSQQTQPDMQQKMDEMLRQPAQPVAPQPMQGMKKKKKANIPAMVLGVVAVLGIGAGVYFGVQYFGEKERADKLAQQNAPVVAEPEEATDEVVVSDVDTAEYIYIGEWGYKIKIPDGLNKVSYAYKVYNGDYEDGWSTSVEVWGVKGDRLYDFANTYAIYDTGGDNRIDTLQHPLGAITREKKGLNAQCQASCDTVIFEEGDWEYTYSHPQDVASLTQAEQKIEMESVELIQQMLSNKANYFEI